MPSCGVYANNNEIACKAGDGKVIATFPDVCLSPPSPPAGPIPIPYPNSSFSKDMSKGSKTVKIKNKEIMLKDQSFYKTSPLGNEAATKSLGAGVISHVITGKTFFSSWSMDVKVEGKNVDRHIDFTTSNHASYLPNASIPWANMSSQEIAKWEEEEQKCACCNQDRHESQIGGTQVSEDDWYDVNENIPPDPPAPNPLNKRATKDWVGETAALKKRREQLNNRQRRLHEAKKNGCLPEKPCNVYRIITPEKNDAAEVEWREYSQEYHKSGPGTGKKVKGGSYEKTNHGTPLSAGGCPIGDSNLTPDSRMSKACLDNDDELTEIHGELAQKRLPKKGS